MLRFRSPRKVVDSLCIATEERTKKSVFLSQCNYAVNGANTFQMIKILFQNSVFYCHNNHRTQKFRAEIRKRTVE